MMEKIKLIVVLAQKSRHIVEAYGIKQTHDFLRREGHVWMGAVEKVVLLILYVISIARVTRGGGIVSRGHRFNL